MNAELEALHLNKTWTITDLPQGKKPIGCKWVFKIKHKADGSIERYKARLVAKGLTQLEEIDFFDTFSPIAKLTTIRLLLSIASCQNWHLHQLDVHNAFLHGHLEEACKLLKSIYGLKQSNRQWFTSLSPSLISKGYSQSQSDNSLFTKRTNHSFTAILIYVDDLILTGNNITEIADIKEFLNCTFRIKDLGHLKYFLGLEIARNKTGIHLCQRKYALEILSDCVLIAAKPLSTPMAKGTKLTRDQETPLSDPENYRRLVGRLTYLTTT